MALAPGDLLFVGWDADNEDVSFIATTQIAAGEIIYFTDDERDENGFFGSEQLFEWTVPAGGIPAGSVVSIDMDPDANSVTFSSGGTVDYIKGGYELAVSNEMVWAFQGTRSGNTVTPTNFIAVIANEADGSDRQTPNLSGTGLTTANGALIIDGDEDYMEWVADDTLPDPVSRDDLIASIMDTGNWVTADGTGNNNPNGSGFNVSSQSVVCFVAGTQIATPDGTVAVERLVPGDMIRTHDGRDVPVKWVGSRKITRAEMQAMPTLCPVRISAGALGQGLPVYDLLVSRQHRILLCSKIAMRMFGKAQVLIPAIQLTRLPGIFIDEQAGPVSYHHVLCEDHEVMIANGAPTESLYLGAETLKALSEEARAEIGEILADLPVSGADASQLCPGRPEQKRLIRRHLRNNKPVLELL